MNLSEFEDNYEEIAELRGAMLDTPVSELMAGNPLVVEADATLVAAINAMNERRTGCVLVAQRGNLVGILTERDVLRAVATGQVEGTHVAAWMTRDPETVGLEDTSGHAAALMIHGGFRHLPVLDAGAPVGIVSIRDLMRVALEDVSPRGV